MEKLNTDQMTFTEVRHLPIVKQYAKRLNLVETINRLVDTQMELSPGIAILAMVLDTLSGRSPLYRLTEFNANDRNMSISALIFDFRVTSNAKIIPRKSKEDLSDLIFLIVFVNLILFHTNNLTCSERLIKAL